MVVFIIIYNFGIVRTCSKNFGSFETLFYVK